MENISRTHYDSTNWMQFLDGNRLISEFSIPGTHESGTYNVYESTGVGYVKCQSLSLADQLNIGCRYFDIRLRTFDERTLLLYHGPFPLHLDFGHVLRECINFLRNHPSEVVLMCVKGSCAPDISSTFMKYYNEAPSIWYTRNRIPKLDQVRGKIVLLSRFSAPLGIDARFPENCSGSYQFEIDPQQTLFCEDRYNPSSLKEKISNIQRNIRKSEDNTNPNNLFLTITSGYMVLWYTPYGMSCRINKWIASYLRKNRYKNKGIVAFDFVDFALAKLVISNNFAAVNGYDELYNNADRSVQVNGYGNIYNNENTNMPTLQALNTDQKKEMRIITMQEKQECVTINSKKEKDFQKASYFGRFIYVICLGSMLFFLVVILRIV